MTYFLCVAIMPEAPSLWKSWKAQVSWPSSHAINLPITELHTVIITTNLSRRQGVIGRALGSGPRSGSGFGFSSCSVSWSHQRRVNQGGKLCTYPRQTNLQSPNMVEATLCGASGGGSEKATMVSKACSGWGSVSVSVSGPGSGLGSGGRGSDQR